MVKPVFKHQDDDGDLSIFTAGDVVLITCEHGHYWVIEAKQRTAESVTGIKEMSSDQVAQVFRSLE